MKCIACGNESWKKLYPVRDRMFLLPGTFTEYSCLKCNLLRLDPVPKNLKKYYPPRKYYSYESNTSWSLFGFLRTFFIRHKLHLFVPAMPHPVASGRLLDLGCGSGETLFLLKNLGWQVYGLDIDHHAIASARRKGLTNVTQGTHEGLAKYPDHFFDVIRLHHVIEHIPKPDDFCELARRKLRPGGELILGTPNSESIVAKVMKQYWYNLDAPRHVFIFSPHSLQQLAKKYGFYCTSIRYASAGGWLGSFQYMIEERLQKKVDLINRQWLVLLFYPLEWVLDRFGLGDVFVLRLRLTR